jgi:hypothetical protein
MEQEEDGDFKNVYSLHWDLNIDEWKQKSNII